jgi:hypothetical protein
MDNVENGAGSPEAGIVEVENLTPRTLETFANQYLNFANNNSAFKSSQTPTSVPALQVSHRVPESPTLNVCPSLLHRFLLPQKFPILTTTM